MPYYPPTGFHFKVEFLSNSFAANDVMFQEVDGLSVTVETEDYKEGGENRFTHVLPVRTKYADLKLKRGLLLDSRISDWVRAALEKFDFEPLDLIVTLLNEEHAPMASWNIVSAIPIEWTMSPFNAEENKLVIESLTLKYQYFNMRNES